MHILLFAQSNSLWTYIFPAVWKHKGVTIKYVFNLVVSVTHTAGATMLLHLYYETDIRK